MNEKEASKFAKAIMPSGFLNRCWTGVHCFEWHKSRGHLGAQMLRRSVEKAKSLGFIRMGCDARGNPDGSVVGNNEVYESNGWVLTVSFTYGGTADSNSFYATLEKKELVVA